MQSTEGDDLVLHVVGRVSELETAGLVDIAFESARRAVVQEALGVGVEPPRRDRVKGVEAGVSRSARQEREEERTGAPEVGQRRDAAPNGYAREHLS